MNAIEKEVLALCNASCDIGEIATYYRVSEVVAVEMVANANRARLKASKVNYNYSDYMINGEARRKQAREYYRANKEKI